MERKAIFGGPPMIASPPPSLSLSHVPRKTRSSGGIGYMWAEQSCAIEWLGSCKHRERERERERERVGGEGEALAYAYICSSELVSAGGLIKIHRLSQTPCNMLSHTQKDLLPSFVKFLADVCPSSDSLGS